jgi:hypothetical protein
VVPTNAPVICSPSPVVVAVAQRTVVNCTEQGFEGPIVFTLSDPTVASVQSASGTYTFFYVSGLKKGTTTLSLGTGNGVLGKDTIIVP